MRDVALNPNPVLVQSLLFPATVIFLDSNVWSIAKIFVESVLFGGTEELGI